MCLGGDSVPDYKEMYFKLFRATEKAINLLIEVQRECEDLYISAPEEKTNVIHAKNDEVEDKR